MATPHEVHVPDETLSKLQQKLALATLPDELDDSDWGYGAPLSEVKRLVQYWRTTFDWRAQEAKLNQLPSFHRKVPIDGFGELDIHYLHQPSSSPNAIPLLFVHGWPGSYLEVTKLLPLLKDESNGVAFRVIAPSLPNFGWSEGVRKKGFGLRQYAQCLDRLMRDLGYERYVTQGGDWGMMITRTMGLLFPERVLASHVNLVRGAPPKLSSQPFLAAQHALTPYTAPERAGLKRTAWFLAEGAGYRTQQATKPQTLGYGLTDSPVALLAWLLEKLHDWTDAYAWTADEILTWVSVYYFSRAGPTASLRIYYEATHQQPGDEGFVHRDRTGEWVPGVKLGLLHAPREITVQPRLWGRTMGPVVFESVKAKGGHFFAWEQPEELVRDLREMFGRGGACFGVLGDEKAKL